MTSHVGLMLLFAAFVSAVFGVLSREAPIEQGWFALRLFAGFVGTAYVLGWLLFPLPL